ncbi:MAG: hypothetical protein J6K45_04285 [Clostridia bacterium]|nr:hypothetical protein [Clostridia bacterium]
MYNIPASKEKYTYSVDSFMGVDFTSSPIEVDKKRSPNARNIINNNGYNETRNGYKILNKIGSKINGVWNIDTEEREMFIVHSGTILYECSSDFKTFTNILSGMTDNRSIGIYFNEYLLIFDGTRTVVYGNFNGEYKAQFLDEVGYIPTTSIARDSSGGGTDYEKINLVSPYRINTFLPEKIKNDDGTEIDQTVFPLEEGNVESIKLIEVLQSDGTFKTITNYQLDQNTGKVTMEAPGESPILGRDSVYITYKIKDNSNNASKINQCDIAVLFGYEGNNNRIFVSGNPDLPNYDYYCEQDDPLYWPDENFTRIGTEAIMSYSRLGDGTLAVHKKQSDTDCTVYYRDTNLLDTIEVFPLSSGVKNIGCISKYCNCNLLNDPLVLTNQGVFAIIGNNGEKYAQQRSYYINKKLMEEENLENAVALSVNGKYYLAVNNHMYIADCRYLSYPKHSKTEQYQYEWWYWDNIPARVLFSWNNELYFGTEDGNICGFTNEYMDIDNPIDVYWETPFLELNSSNLAKTIRNVTLILNPGGYCDITFGYILDDGSVEIITKNYSALNDDFPKTIQEKEKIPKFMFVKFFMKNNTKNRMTFERLILEYINSGKYRGE